MDRNIKNIINGRLLGLLSESIKHGVRVFCYHGVVENRTDIRLERNLQLLSVFKKQIQYLRRFQVLTLNELLEVLKSPPKKQRKTMVITFDDGYANNLQAAEILASAHLPWCIFVSTGALGRNNAIWTVELSLLMLHGQAEKVEALGKIWPLTSRRDREVCFQSIRYPLKALPADLRIKAMDNIRRQFPAEETQRLLQKFPSLQMLTWYEVSQLAGSGVEIGSHGVYHEIHHADQPESIRRQELVDSKAEIERRLGFPCRFFAFPNGDSHPGSAAEAEAAGYKLAFTLESRNIQPRDNLCLIPRMEAGTRIYKSWAFF